MTRGGTTPADPAVLSNVRVLPNGKVAFDLRGSPGTTYSVQKEDRLDAANWPEIGTVQTDVGGAGVYQTPQAVGTTPQFTGRFPDNRLARVLERFYQSRSVTPYAKAWMRKMRTPPHSPARNVLPDSRRRIQPASRAIPPAMKNSPRMM